MTAALLVAGGVVLAWVSYRFGRAAQQVDDWLAIDAAVERAITAERKAGEAEAFLRAVQP